VLKELCQQQATAQVICLALAINEKVEWRLVEEVVLIILMSFVTFVVSTHKKKKKKQKNHFVKLILLKELILGILALVLVSKIKFGLHIMCVKLVLAIEE